MQQVGVIPDPEVKAFDISPATGPKADGDLFIIVASDGVWEFISSHKAAEIVVSRTPHPCVSPSVRVPSPQAFPNEGG